MSDIQLGPGWWQASDRKWYPPETHPSRQTPPPMQPPGQPPTYGHQIPTPGYSVPPAGPATPSSGYPVPPPGPSVPPAGQPPWGNPYSPYGFAPAAGPFPAPRPTNGLAIASLACSVAGIIPFLFGISCVVGIVLGFVSLGQIKRTGGVQKGRGLAIAGIAVGFSLIAIFVLFVILAVVGDHSTSVSGLSSPT
jgi:hypothetical protein